MRLKSIVILCICLFIVTVYACRKAEPFPNDELDARLSGGDCTVFDEGGGAFTHSVSGLSPRDQEVHDLGDKMFEAGFVTAPAPVNAGLGPMYNNRSCVNCHVGDGRGRPQLASEPMQTMIVKLAMPGNDINGAPLPVPGFGIQLQDKAISGIQPEGSVQTSWSYENVTLTDGSIVELRRPSYTFINPYISIPAGMIFSVRIPNPVFGMGLLEGIEEASILAHADPMDANGDGISGRPNYVYDYVTNQPHKLGRVGWKATSPDGKGQTAKALTQDIGITTSVFPKENADGQPQMLTTYIQQPYDLHDSLLQSISFYIKTLAVPARRNTDNPLVKNGQLLFTQIGCVKCHVDNHITNVDVALRPLSAQIIRPYSDLLLHDMGPGLADNYPEFEAAGNEWRTKPLWGLGLTQKVSGHTYMLHDGRARNTLEAILWHGGEAQQVKQRFTNLSKTNREALLKFLESL